MELIQITEQNPWWVDREKINEDEKVKEALSKRHKIELFGAIPPLIVGVIRRLSIRDAERAEEDGADLIELRIDRLGMEESSIEKMKEFVSLLKVKMPIPVPVLITNRKKEEGGSFIGSEDERIGMLSSILDTVEVDAIDIEFSSSAADRKKIVEKAKRLHIPVIFSFHDFNGMPGRSELLNLIARMYDEGGSIAKIAVTPETFRDALSLLSLTDELSREGKLLAAIGMGPVGRHLRVIAPLYGSVLTYGVIEGEEEVAPGQFSVKELRSILKRLI
ncbi:MAG: type I 3-dehydroquinate dehydratase [Methanophagales archaeon]|nr:type I 3-dehydroquinate dehydratase [Methanophagales archaeon]